MELVLNNPFRILGLPSNTSEKELQKQLSIIKRYSEVGKKIASDFDFNFLGKLERNEDKVSRAASQIDQEGNKIFHALFWFIKYNQIDEIAINHLKNNDFNKAIEIWSKVTATGIVNENNFNAFNNLSTISLGLSVSNGSIDVDLLRKAIDLKLRFLTSNSFNYFSSSVSGNGFNEKSKQFSEKFVDELIETLATLIKNNQLNLKDVISIFSNATAEIKKRVVEYFTLVPIRKIESKLDKSAHELQENPEQGYKIGEKLFYDCRDELINLKGILGATDLQYQSIANNSANEIIDCSIAHFNGHKDDENYDPVHDCVRLTKYANSIAVNGPVKHRIKESLEFLKKWELDAPEREVFKKIGTEAEFIFNYLNGLTYASVSKAREIIRQCKPKLNLVRSKIGNTSIPYINLSSAVANNVLGMLIEVFNTNQEKLQYNPTYIFEFKAIVNEIVDLLENIEAWDVSSDISDRITQNQTVILATKFTLNEMTNKSQSKSSGCYIATLVYGSYDHHQVKLLRMYRDKVLLESFIGKRFVKIYYHYSPYMVKKLKGKITIQKIVRNLLDQIIKFIE